MPESRLRGASMTSRLLCFTSGGLWREPACPTRYGRSGRDPSHHPVPHAAHHPNPPPSPISPLLGGREPAASRCTALTAATALPAPPTPDCRRRVTRLR